VGDFAAHVDEYFREHYQLGGSDPYFHDESDKVFYEQRGSSLLEILSDDLGSSDNEVVKAIIENLPDFSHREIAQGAEPFYDDTASYESIADVEAQQRADDEEYWYENRFTYQWKDFCEKVQYERRFFRTKELLDKLFGKPSEYQEGEINPVYLLNAPQRIFRARILDGNFTEEVLKNQPARELGAPPRERAAAGRMNVEYIPAFYGAFSEETAVAEMRPGIGERVAIGEFALQKDVKVFDFTVFSRAPHEEPSNDYPHTRYGFIKQMEHEISRRVLPYEKQLQYISTQIVAEYLKQYFGCEAVIYSSSVVRGPAADRRNIVFLPRAEGFVGENMAVLKYRVFAVKEVRDVNYQLVEDLF
jgi:RES domain